MQPAPAGSLARDEAVLLLSDGTFVEGTLLGCKMPAYERSNLLVRKAVGGEKGRGQNVQRIPRALEVGKRHDGRKESEPFGNAGRRLGDGDARGGRTSNLAVRHVDLLTTRSPRGSRYVVDGGRPHGSVSLTTARSYKFDQVEFGKYADHQTFRMFSLLLRRL